MRVLLAMVAAALVLVSCGGDTLDETDRPGWDNTDEPTDSEAHELVQEFKDALGPEGEVIVASLQGSTCELAQTSPDQETFLQALVLVYIQTDMEDVLEPEEYGALVAALMADACPSQYERIYGDE
jgi:hypothetical protein